MTKGFLCCLTIMTLILWTAGAGEPAKDLAKLQGTWGVVDMIESGQKVPKDEVAELMVTVKGDVLTVKVKEKVEAAFSLKLDPGQKPAGVDLTHTIGDLKGKKMLGIYKTDGGMFHICFDEEGRDRPKEFASQAKSNVTLVVMKKKETVAK